MPKSKLPIALIVQALTLVAFMVRPSLESVAAFVTASSLLAFVLHLEKLQHFELDSLKKDLSDLTSKVQGLILGRMGR